MPQRKRTSAKPYNPHDTEAKVYRRWERAKAFTPASAKAPAGKPAAKFRRRRRVFSIVIPPPNITGSLHMGHALQDTVMDVLTRFHRMQGDDTLWVPGTDHAGIATQNVVEKELRKEGKTRHDLGRDAFVRRVWQWREQYGKTITEQMQTLGCSCDWTRERFTMDPEYIRAVQEAFIHYAQKGLIYRGDRIVNWCPRCSSSISDLEVKYEERVGTLYFLRYPLTSSLRAKRSNPDEIASSSPAPRKDYLVVATTRPETMLGDTAVAVHPEDARYRSLVSKTVVLPLAERELPVVADHSVDHAFGTGAVKVTPAHDHADAEIAERQNLPAINVIGEDGRMTDAVPSRYRGLSVDEARAKVLEDLRAQGLLEREESVRHRVSLCDRCGTIIEPLISKQWFVKMAPLAKPAIEVVQKKLVRFTPARWEMTYLDWLRHVGDWCVSRQLWWGHQLPVWYCQTGKRTGNREQGTGAGAPLSAGHSTLLNAESHVVFSIAKPKKCPECGGSDFVQDPDVLDTWFSSALWPFAVFGWPEATADLKRFYPTSVLTTAQEILQLWVARMVFSGLEFMNRKTYAPARHYGKTNAAQRVPFRDVIIHQTVLNLKGQRMSKSLGTGVDPMELVEQYGADAARFGLLVQTQRDQQSMRFDENAVRTGRNVVNKLWNLARFLERTGDREHGAGKRRRRSTTYNPEPTPFDEWIRSRLSSVTQEVTAAIETFRFGDAMRILHAFLWDDVADWYIEVSKVPGMATPVVAREVFATLLQLLHPFLPFVTEALWAEHGEGGMLITARWPGGPRRTPRAGAASARVAEVQHVVRGLRSARSLLGVPPRQKLRAGITSRATQPFFAAIAFLAHCDVALVHQPGPEWIVLPGLGGSGVRLHRDTVRGIDVRQRLTLVERRTADLQQKIADGKRRLAVMRQGAPAEVVAKADASLKQLRADLQEQTEAAELLRGLVGTH